MPNCYLPWQACSINELGNVKACCVHWKSMGTLARSGFESIWNGPRYRRLRRGVYTRPDSICHTCRMPRFDSDQSKSFSQLVPGFKEMLRDLRKVRRRRYKFTGILGGSIDPSQVD